MVKVDYQLIGGRVEARLSDGRTSWRSSTIRRQGVMPKLDHRMIGWCNVSGVWMWNL